MLVFGEFDEVPVVPISGLHCLVRIIKRRFSKRMIVPFNTRDLASLAADARRHIDILTDFFLPTSSPPWNWPRMGRDFLDLKCAWITHVFLECGDLSWLSSFHDSK